MPVKNVEENVAKWMETIEIWPFRGEFAIVLVLLVSQLQ
jgi:hypothetical protein